MTHDAARTTSSAAADTTDGGGERTIPLPPGPLRLDVRNPPGTIEIVGRVRPDVLVAWTKAGDPASDAWRRASVRIEASGDAIAVAPDFGQHGVAAVADVPSLVSAAVGAIAAVIGNGSGGVCYDLRVEVPVSLPGAAVTTRTASGGIRLSGVGAATLSANAASGHVAVEGCGGVLELNTASGRLSLARCSGRVSANTASGAIEVLVTRPLDLSANTASGAIHLQLEVGATGEARCNTASGVVTVEAPPELGVAVSVRTASGGVSAEPPFAAEGRREWRSGNGRDYRVKARTASGGIRLRAAAQNRAEPEAASATAWVSAPAPVPSSSATSGSTRSNGGATTAARQPILNSPAITPEPIPTQAPGDSAPSSGRTPRDRPAADELLQAVERGEIGVDEALRLLDERTGEPVEPA